MAGKTRQKNKKTKHSNNKRRPRTWNVVEVSCRMEVVSEPVKCIDSGLHVELRRELKERFFGGSPLQGRHNTIQHPVNVVLFLLE